MSTFPIPVDHDLHDVLVGLVHDLGPHDVTWLAKRARRLRRDARVTEQAVLDVIEVATLLVPRPDGTVAHLRDVLDGIVLTHRVRASTAGRSDLWIGSGVQPFLAMAALRPIPVVGGGHVEAIETQPNVLVGPPGWLPVVPRFGLVGLRLTDGVLAAEPVGDDDLVCPEEQEHVRRLLGDHVRRELWWGDGDPALRPGEVIRALAIARLEDPDLLCAPHPPLDELLYNPLEAEPDRHHWREFSAARQEESIGVSLNRMPVPLHHELAARAKHYGMSFDQFVIAILGHLAWRTPFAEDIEPWDQWDPDWRPKPNLVQLFPERDDD